MWRIYSQYHGCWWLADARSHGVNSHNIGWVFRNFLVSESERWTDTKWYVYTCIFVSVCFNLVVTVCDSYIGMCHQALTHWGRVTHIYVGKLIIIGSDNGLSPDRRQAIIWTNAGLLSIGPLRTYFSENLIKVQQFSLKRMHVKMSSAKWRPSCLGLNVLRNKSYSFNATTGPDFIFIFVIVSHGDINWPLVCRLFLYEILCFDVYA